MKGREERSALEFLESLIEDTPQVQRAARRERLRLELARFMKKAREAAGLTQKEVAEALSVTQAWVSKLESPNYDHKLESVLSYFDALGGDMKLSVDVAESTFHIWGEAPVWTVYLEPLVTKRWEGVLPYHEGGFAWDWCQPEVQETEGTQSDHVVEFEHHAAARRVSQGLRKANAI